MPVAFRQREQWQFKNESNGSSTSKATSPHKQLPRNAAIVVSSLGLVRQGLDRYDIGRFDNSHSSLVQAIQLKIARAFWRDYPMKPKSSAQLGAIACVAFACVATSAYGQGGGYYYGEGYRGEGYRGGGYRYGPPVRCLSSDGVNASLANRGLYPVALVGQSPDEQILYMRVSQGPQVFIATVDGCTGQVLRMQGYYGY